MTGRISRSIWILGLALVGAALACSAPGFSGAQPSQAPTAAGSDAFSVSSPTAGLVATAAGGGQAQPTSGDPTASCPAATAGTTQIISKENGFCFLIPAEMKSSQPMNPAGSSAAFSGQVVDPGAPSPLSAFIEVTYNGPADVADGMAYATKWRDVYNAGQPDPTPATIAGQPAGVLDIPGQMEEREAFVVAGGQKYSITSPKPGQYDKIDALVDKAWSTVTGSIVFFPPTNVPKIIRAEDVCPKASGDNLALIDWGGGVCMLYPKSFEIDPQNAIGRGWFNGGPVLGQLNGQPVRANLTISNAGPANGQTPRQLWQPYLANQDSAKMDVAGAKDVTLSGQPALVWTQGAPEGSRNAILVGNSQAYTIVNQPYNDPNYPGGADNVELVWNTVTQSLAFFDPWR